MIGRGLDACLKSLRAGDTLVVWKLDRLGRNLHHLVNVVHDLTGLGIGLKVLAGEGASIDTTTCEPSACVTSVSLTQTTHWTPPDP
jgi:DNA invertase Pin-like site-specific DNA recombinase